MAGRSSWVLYTILRSYTLSPPLPPPPFCCPGKFSNHFHYEPTTSHITLCSCAHPRAPEKVGGGALFEPQNLWAQSPGSSVTRRLCLCPLTLCLTPGNWLLCPQQKICQLEPEGLLKVDLVLRAAEALLACCPEDQKPAILARLRDIKAQWEETVTYMTHCHR